MSHSNPKEHVGVPEQLLLADWGSESPQRPLAVPARIASDGRSTAVWRQWLSSMATDAEAALAAAIAYREMDTAGREKWLASLDFDAPEVNVPRVALYAPLLAVEQDPVRRDRLIFALSQDPDLGMTTAPQQAWSGREASGTEVYVLSSPLYLNFVQVLACGVNQGAFVWVKHDPILAVGSVPREGQQVGGAVLERSPVNVVLDELAVAVLSHQRRGRPLPEALQVLGDLLGALGP